MNYLPRGLLDTLVRPAGEAFGVILGAEVIVAIVSAADKAARWAVMKTQQASTTETR